MKAGGITKLKAVRERGAIRCECGRNLPMQTWLKKKDAEQKRIDALEKHMAEDYLRRMAALDARERELDARAEQLAKESER